MLGLGCIFHPFKGRSWLRLRTRPFKQWHHGSPRHNRLPFAISALIGFVGAVIRLFPPIHFFVVVRIINHNHLDKYCITNALCDFDEKCGALIRSVYIFITVLVELINIDHFSFRTCGGNSNGWYRGESDRQQSQRSIRGCVLNRR